MQVAIRTTTHVLPGGQVTVSDPELKEGQRVEVIVLPEVASPAVDATAKQSIVEFLESLPRVERPPEYWDDRDRELQQERDSWDR